MDLSTGKNTPSPYQEELLSRGSSDGARGNPSPSVGGSLNEEKHGIYSPVIGITVDG